MKKDWKTIGQKCLQDEADALMGLKEQIDESFNTAVDIILACEGKVIITGVGKSGHIGAKIAATMSSTGTPSFFVNPLDAFHGDLGVITKKDVVLAISNSGQTDELLRFLPYLLDLKIPIIGMSGNIYSKLAEFSTVHLNISVPYETGRLGLAPTSSTTAQLAMGDALACALMDARKFNASEFAHYHPGGSLGKRLLTKAKNVMRKEDLPIISPETSMKEVIISMSNGRLGLCVAVQNGKICGILTDGDLRRALQANKDSFFDLPVKKIMTLHPKEVTPETSIADIEEILQKYKIHCVLVADEEHHLLGIVDTFSTNL